MRKTKSKSAGKGTTTTKGSTTPPPDNIGEFKTITGLVFAQLYKQCPIAVDLERGAIASAVGVCSGDKSQVLLSGRPFTEVFAHSLNWLSEEGYVRSAGLLPHEKITLTHKGLAALNAVQGPRRMLRPSQATGNPT
jgi:hypothetical protein